MTILERVIQLRRGSEKAPADASEPDQGARFQALEERMNHLEALVEGLQDAVHRESKRRGEQIEQLEQKTEPAQMARSLKRDERERGL